MLSLVSSSPFSRSAEETSLDTKMDQVDPNTPRLLSSPPSSLAERRRRMRNREDR
jgi:hypothetical protein